MNTITMTAEAVENLNERLVNIKKTETYEEAISIANEMKGFLHCLDMVGNMMDSSTEEYRQFDRMVNRWWAKLYGEMANQAAKHNKASEIINACIEERDAYMDAIH